MIRTDRIEGIFTAGTLFTMTFSESAGVQRTVVDLTRISKAYLSIINDARMSCTDPDIREVLNTMDAKSYTIFDGVKGIIPNMTKVDGRLNNLVLPAPFTDINNIRTNISTSTIRYSWGVSNFILIFLV